MSTGRLVRLMRPGVRIRAAVGAAVGVGVPVGWVVPRATGAVVASTEAVRTATGSPGAATSPRRRIARGATSGPCRACVPASASRCHGLSR
ncbi:hypothetical protein PV338_11810, partial [Streptomyces scabiei]|nr:hypothetical protein [Streptomyces scabiei]